MSRLSRTLQLDTEHLHHQRARSLPGEGDAWRDGSSSSRPGRDAERAGLLPAESPLFADISLADPPRVLSGVTRTSAGATPPRNASPAPRAHSRQSSDASARPLPERQAHGTTPGGGGEAPPFAPGRRLPEEQAGSSSRAQLEKDWQEGGAGPKQPGSSGSYGSGDSAAEALQGSSSSGAKGCLRGCLSKDPLLFLTVMGVLLGAGAGLALRPARLSPGAVQLLGLPGDVMLRLLKMLVLPLVAGSMVAGVCALRGSAASMARVARVTLGYYALTTVTAVLLGIALVNAITPGRGQPLGSGELVGCHGSAVQGAAQQQAGAPQASPLTALLGVVRSIFPENVARAAVDMNILGVITFSLAFGLALSSLGPAADGFIRGVEVFNRAIGAVVTAVLWASPIGVASLIAASIVAACDLLHTLAALGLWVLTVLLGLAVFGALLLPALLWGATRKSPVRFLRDFSQALLLAFGTSSSSAALPVAMECAARAGCEDSIIRFVLPLGTTVNMNGTALYEATTVIFIAQAHGVQLGVGGTLVVACTATLAAVGAAAIPSAGLVTMLMVLQAVSLERFAADLAIILAIDWLLDRCRTAVNLASDCLAVVLVSHWCRQSEPSYSQIEMA